MTEKFRPGYLFGEKVTKAERRISAARKIRKFIKDEKSSKTGKGTWTFSETPLEHYANFGIGPEKLNFKQYLDQKINSKNEKLKVMDVGIGTGAQWLHMKEKIELWGSSLSGKVHPEIKNNVKRATASNLHKHFPANYFDLAVSDFGTHFQEMEAIENILHLLKPGGEAIISGDEISKPEYTKPDMKSIKNLEKLTEIISDEGREGGFWMIHLRKK